MKRFTYKVKNAAGVASSGVVESISDKAAARTLQERGYLVITLAEKREWSWRDLSSLFGSRVPPREVATFTGLLATMLSTGLPLTDSLDNLATQAGSGYFREVLRSVIHDVQNGDAFSEAVGRFPQVFDTLYVNLVKAGEASGKMDEVLTKLAQTLESNLDFQARVKGAMTYPVIVISTMLAVAIFLLTSVIPKIGEVYKQFGADLPLATRILIGIAYFMSNYFLVGVFLLVLAAFGVRTLLRNPTSEYALNNFWLRMPVVGALESELTVTIICRTLGMLLYSGVAILDSLNIVAKAVPNNYFRSGILAAVALVEKGMPLSVAIRRNSNFPLIMSQLLAIGEQTGTIDQSLLKVASFYETITERKVKTLTALLEPVMILVMGVMIAGLALAVLMPMFNLVNVIR